MNRTMMLLALASLSLGACSKATEPLLLGTLERERVAVTADASERIVRIDVAEGDEVYAGDAILSLDTRRIDAGIEQARAVQRGAEAALDKLRNGTRIETIDAARATLSGAEASALNARRERDRLAELRERGLIAQADLDRAETALRNAQAQRDGARARLAELLNGTRIEDIEQAEANLAAATATLAGLELNRARYDIVAPRDGRVDALPFKLGDEPAPGAVLVSLLAGSPYARIYVPASQRNRMQLGMSCSIAVTGVDKRFPARLRSVRSDPAFTPYFALTGDDASRLSYRAELVMTDADAAKLPAGLPVQAECGGKPDDAPR
jgi:HlyD family secretion protein